MAKNKTGLLIAGGAALAFFLARGASRLKQTIQTQLIYKKVNFSKTGLTVTLQLNITNPTGNSFDIKSISGVLQYEGNTVANIIGLKEKKVAPNSLTVYDLDVNITTRSIVTKWLANPAMWKELTAKYNVLTSVGLFKREEKLNP